MRTIEEAICWKVNGKIFDNKQEAKEYEAKIWLINEIYELGFSMDDAYNIFDNLKYFQEIIEKYNDKTKEVDYGRN